MNIKRPTISPSMIVAIVALFVALGGVAYAGVTLSNNTIRSNHIVNGQVKNADLANNAVTTAKVKNGTLAAADLSAAAQATLKGNAGPAGPAGPSDAFSTFHDGLINLPLAETTLVTLNVPAGKYVAFAKGLFGVNTTFPAPTCKLVAGADSDTTSAFFNGPTQYTVPFALNVTHEFAAAGAFEFRCSLGNGTANITASQIKITAIKVGTLSSVAG